MLLFLALFVALFFFDVKVSAAQCTNLIIPVDISVRQNTFELSQILNNLDATSFALNFTLNAESGSLAVRAKTGEHNVSGRYEISAKFCRPNTGVRRDSTVQFLIHGIGFDKSYWDLPIDNYKNSYQNVAVDEYGYCTLAIDRFGIAGSSKADPYNTVQAPATMTAMLQITNMLRAGSLPGVPFQFNKVVHVGHSFGSFLSYLLVTAHPTASDALILTGYSAASNWFAETIAGWNMKVARLNQPLRFGNPQTYYHQGRQSGSSASPTPQLLNSHVTPIANPLSQENQKRDGDSVLQYLQQFLFSIGIPISEPDLLQDLITTELGNIITGWTGPGGSSAQNLPPGYLTWSDLSANIYAFLYAGYFDLNSAIFAEATKQPFTPGELMTIGVAPPTAPSFKGPVLVYTGRQDNIYCGGDCLSTNGQGESIPAAVADSFPAAKTFRTYIQPDTGHGMNFHYNASAGYRVIQDFLREQGFQG